MMVAESGLFTIRECILNLEGAGRFLFCRAAFAKGVQLLQPFVVSQQKAVSFLEVGESSAQMAVC